MLIGVNHDVPNGIGMARFVWSRLPAADGEGAGPSTSEATNAAIESLDYELIGIHAYWEEHVCAALAHLLLLPSILDRVVLVCGQLSCLCCWVGVGTTEQVLGALLRHAQVVVRSADRRWEFKILNLLEFNSKRKRMTVILQNEDGQFFLYCKGADRLSMLRKPKAYRCEQGIGCDISCQMGTNKHNICSPS